jgi:hypothetical protein
MLEIEIPSKNLSSLLLNQLIGVPNEQFELQEPSKKSDQRI